MGTFGIDKSGDNTNLVIQVRGNIDEDANFSGSDLSTLSGQVVFDLDKVTAINSCGIREWIKWVRTAPSTAKLVYRHCPKVIVDQINMVAGFLPENGTVESFYVPYYSDASGSEKMVLFRAGKEFKGGEVFPPEDVKDDAGEPMEMDVIEAKYFKFLGK